MIFNFYFSVSELINYVNESSQYWSVLLDQNPLQLDRKGIKKGKTERGVAVVGGGGTITQRRQLFQIFPFKGGDHLRTAMNRRMAII